MWQRVFQGTMGILSLLVSAAYVLTVPHPGMIPVTAVVGGAICLWAALMGDGSHDDRRR